MHRIAVRRPLTLHFVCARTPIGFRRYKFLIRTGDTQSVPGPRREADCSLAESCVDLADYAIAAIACALRTRSADGRGFEPRSVDASSARSRERTQARIASRRALNRSSEA